MTIKRAVQIQIFAVGLAMMECVGCSSIVAPSPVSGNAHIGIALSSHTLIPLSPFDRRLTAIYFARIEEDQSSFVSNVPLIPSNAQSGNRFYLLNAQPGRYVAMAAFEKIPHMSAPTGPTGSVHATGGGTEFHLVFAKPLVALTEVQAEPGRLAFMGDFLVTGHLGWSGPEADELQRNTISRMGLRSNFQLGSVNKVGRGVDSEQRFLLKAKDDLSESGWEPIIQRSLELLSKK